MRNNLIHADWRGPAKPILLVGIRAAGGLATVKARHSRNYFGLRVELRFTDLDAIVAGLELG